MRVVRTGQRLLSSYFPVQKSFFELCRLRFILRDYRSTEARTLFQDQMVQR
jgi:hypothetical protein